MLTSFNSGQKYHKQMERVHVLIDKLVEQKQQNAPASQMLVTVQLLQKELLIQQQNNTPTTSKVTVVMPAHNNAVRHERPAKPIVIEQPKYVEKEVPQPEPAPTFKEEYILRKPIVEEAIEANSISPQPQMEATPRPVVNQAHLPFDPIAETPTLMQHQPKKEVYQLMMQPEDEQKAAQELSLNDKLKQEKIELGQVLKESPIKDLRKAIGINDKFTFVNELFRGDEAMYERSIKTINSFNILPEAEYWINRELKVKLGWNDSKDVVQHFYQLVRRRFS